MHPNLHQSVLLTHGFWIAEFVLSAALLVLARIRKAPLFFWLRAFLVLKCISFPILFTLVRFKPFGHTVVQQYSYYFYPYWVTYTVEALICFLVIRELFLASLEPLQGLRRLGLILFAWVATISLVVALTVSVGPSHSGIQFLMMAISEFERCQSVLQLSLLLFLAVVARPLGVEPNNRIFGASLGFSILAVSDLVMSGWFHSQTLVSTINIFHSAALPAALCVWTAYVFLPEPKRQPISLPVTSALLRWNEVATTLGRSGGRIVISGQRELVENELAAWDRAVEVVRAKHPDVA
jgi:hypothetical protein